MKNKQENQFAWKVSADEVIKRNYNLDFKNPFKVEEEKILPKEEIIAKIEGNLKRSSELLTKIRKEFSF